MNAKKIYYLFLGLLIVGLTLTACSQDCEECPEPTPCPDCPECPEVECPDCPECPPPPECPEVECPECPDCPECPECEEPIVDEVPFAEMWAQSGHADAEAEAFRHWDEDDPQVVPTRCAKCHSSYGYLDFLGADGTEAGVVDNDAPVDSTVDCVACHNQVTAIKTTAVMPSGAELTGLGPEARCIECHQGRASTASVDNAIAEAGPEDMDTVSEDLGFTNIHYFAAAATMYGTEAMGGYEYEGKAYDAKFEHVEGYDTCMDCHDSHTLELKVDACADCHTGVASVEDLRAIRTPGSLVDYDGDGDMEEGIAGEIEGLQETLYETMQTYAADVAGTPIVYDSHAYPYFFTDTNADGEAGEDEANYGNQYNAWTGRLAKAAYNYQTSLKDPGAYVHGGKYIIQLLYDSIEDLDAAMVEGLRRIDHGHFAGSEEAFRHWDEDDPAVISASCAKCHSADGLPFYIQEGVNVSQPPSNGLDCATCHSDLNTYAIYEMESVEFPSGAMLDSGDPAGNLCLNCHQGRASTASVDGRIAGAGVGDDKVSEDLGFVNVHYFAAGATLFGSEAMGAYQYQGKEYVGRFVHVTGYDTCIGCHDTHALEVEVAACGSCHPGTESAEDLAAIRIDPTDYDGDGDAEEGIAGEIETLHEALYAAMQDYAANTIGTGIVYDSHSYPYFFTDTNENGEADPDEANYGNQYATWTPRLLRAAYNYQYAAKDPGGSAHNAKYIIQALYDALEDLGADVAGMTRP